jgi:putative ABC transport system permease protein
MDALLQDIRYALRTLRQSPGFTAIAVLTLALGIGANTTIFSVVNGLVIRPLPFTDAERVDIVYRTLPKRGFARGSVSYADLLDLRAQSRSFSGLAAYSEENYNLSAGEETDYVDGAEVTANLFELLGVEPVLGRDFRGEEDQPGRDGVVLLSYTLWQRRFAGRRDAIGQTLSINGRQRTVVGVLPPKFTFPYVQKLWVPLVVDPKTPRAQACCYRVIGRRAPGVTQAQAEAELQGVARRLAEQYPDADGGQGVRIAPYREELVDPVTRLYLAVLLSAVGLVLLIACANVANLALARATSRQREIAVRTALGAGRVRLIRQFLTESIVIALGGGALGVLFALWGINLSKLGILEEIPYWVRWELNTGALAFTVGLSVVTGLVFGTLPALEASKGDLHAALKEGGGGRAGVGGRGRHRLRNALVVGEIALSLMLLVGSTLMIRTFLSISRVNPGFDPKSVLTMRLYLAGDRYGPDAARIGFFRDALQRVQELPGVAAAAGSNGIPVSDNYSATPMVFEGQPVARGEEPVIGFRTVTDGYFRALQIPLLSGRTFLQRETLERSMVAVVNQTLAHRFWPGGEAIGRRLRFTTDSSEAWRTVVGVVGNVQEGELDSKPEPQVYVPYADFPRFHMSLTVRTVGVPGAAAPAVRAAVRAVDPGIALFEVMPYPDLIVRSFWPRRLVGLMLAVFAGIALLLAAVGVYGVMAYAVAQRTHEIGLRMALGAEVGHVLRLVVGQGLTLAGIGLLIGLVGAFGLTRGLATLLFGVSATDPLSYIAISLLLAVTTLAASYIPARRAARVEPLVALRSE